jgi:RNA polymerase sigma factor (TIGR02999 family)
MGCRVPPPVPDERRKANRGKNMHSGVLTQLLHRATEGDAEAANEVWTLVYRDIRAMAAAAIAGEARRDQFEPTMVVHEVYLRLVANPEQKWNSRRHFFGAVARAMEQFLIDAARTFSRKKRKAVFVDQSVAELSATIADSAQSRTGEDAIRLLKQVARLEKDSPEAAEIIRFRYVFGLTNQQVAAALGMQESEVANLVRFGRAFIANAMEQDDARR